MIGVLTALALGSALLALAVAVALLLKQNAIEKATGEALRDIRVALQAMRNEIDAQKILKAEVGLSAEEIEETVIK